MKDLPVIQNNQSVHEVVKDAYGQIAKSGESCCGPVGGCCSTQHAGGLSAQLGYTEGELAVLPDGADMGLSCGNPTALASLKEGEVVVDLGSGGGFDVFIASRKVGPSGKAIGIDMTPAMIGKASRNVVEFRKQTGLDNVEFRLGQIEDIPLECNIADAVISNCVINLSPDKSAVWREIFRILKPGGRAAISDLALLKPLPREIAESVTALVGCIAGAVLVNETEAMLHEAGFTDIVLESKSGYIDAMTDWNDPLYRKVIETLPPETKVSDYVTSLNVYARKPL